MTGGTVQLRFPEGTWLELGQRVLSALVLATVTVAATVFGGWWFAGWVLVLALVVTHEWFAVSRAPGRWAAAAAVIGSWYAIAFSGSLLAAFYVIAMGAAGTAVFALLRGRGDRALWSAAGTAYAALPLVVLVWIRGTDDSTASVLLWMFLVVWASDTGAYAVGNVIGGPLLAPSISPGKTWSGALGGLVTAMIAGSALATMIFASIEPALLLAALVSLAAQAGDLFQSSFKRRFGVKNSGNLVPGHGGLMDRLDSLILAAPVFAVAWTLAFFLSGAGHG